MEVVLLRLKPSRKHARIIVSVLVVMLCGLLGWLATRDVQKSLAVPKKVQEPQAPWKATPTILRASKRERAEFKDGSTVEVMASSREQEVILRFPSDETYIAFIKAVENTRVAVVDRLDRLRAMRVDFEKHEDLDALLSGENITLYPAVTRMPERIMPDSGVQEGAVGFDDKVISWLRVMGDHSLWGKGVKIAVLDSGVVPHESLPTLTKSIVIEPFPSDITLTHGHGTAVASLIAGNSRIAPGVAPSAEIISIRVANETGVSDSFSISAGLLAAMDEGVQIINVSMGSYEDSPLMADAVWMVQNQGIVIVAASGNDGQDDAAYPAAYPGVISVGAVDARGVQLDFSNYGEYLSLTAPGYMVNTAWPGNRYVRMTGTSMSAPLVTGAIAAAMSPGTGEKLSASEAAALVMEYTDEAGIPGPDSQYGSGILNLGRVMFRNVPGLLDAAITNQRLVPINKHESELQVTIQNRGTSTLINTLVEMETPLGIKKVNATTLAAGACQTFVIPIPANTPRDQPFLVHTRVLLGMPGQDQTPQNNERTDILSLPQS